MKGMTCTPDWHHAVRRVRARMGVTRMEALRALSECDCDVDRACDWLRRKSPLRS